VIEPARNPARSTLAVAVGIVAIVGLSTVTDLLMVQIGAAPDLGTVWPANILTVALLYRCVYGIFGSYLAAQLAPRFPMWHAMFLGVLGFVVSLAGAIYAMRRGDLGPSWYPIGIAVTALPCAWIGGLIHGRLNRDARS
jgi:hypothetical protein